MCAFLAHCISSVTLSLIYSFNSSRSETKSPHAVRIELERAQHRRSAAAEAAAATAETRIHNVKRLQLRRYGFHFIAAVTYY